MISAKQNSFILFELLHMIPKMDQEKNQELLYFFLYLESMNSCSVVILMEVNNYLQNWENHLRKPLL